MSEKHPGPLVVEGKLTDAERMKRESNFLRGTIAEDLNDGLTGGFHGDNFLLIRFHGMYQQDDRDIRAERAEQAAERKASAEATKSSVKKINASVEKTTLGDIAGLAELKDAMEAAAKEEK